jgi:ABC-type glycerol-3-phosphate transport system substrate-binding protein
MEPNDDGGDDDEKTKIKRSRPLNGYTLFVQEFPYDISSNNNNTKGRMSAAAQAWKQLSSKEQQSYKDRAKMIPTNSKVKKSKTIKTKKTKESMNQLLDTPLDQLPELSLSEKHLMTMQPTDDDGEEELEKEEQTWVEEFNHKMKQIKEISHDLMKQLEKQKQILSVHQHQHQHHSSAF